MVNLEFSQDANSSNTEKIKFSEPHGKYPHMNARLNIEYSSTNGRYCKSNNTIKAGDILFSEEPYCAILLPEFCLKYCDCCFKQLTSNEDFLYLNIQTCDECADVLYCSIDCKKKSRLYHKFECSKLEILHDLGIGHLAYRIIACTDSNVLKRYFNSNNSSLQAYFEDLNRSAIKLYSSDDYDTVFNLVTNEQFTHADDLYQYTLTAILLGEILSINICFMLKAGLYLDQTTKINSV